MIAFVFALGGLTFELSFRSTNISIFGSSSLPLPLMVSFEGCWLVYVLLSIVVGRLAVLLPLVLLLLPSGVGVAFVVCILFVNTDVSEESVGTTSE